MAGDLIDQLTSDPDFLSLSDQEQDAMYEELSGRQQKYSNTQAFDAGAATRNREVIEARKSPVEQYGLGMARRIGEAVKDPLGAIAKRTGPLGTVELLRDGVPAIGAATQTLESILAEAGLGAQQGGTVQTPQGAGANMIRALRGESAAQIGDIPRASGLPVISSEPVAAGIGLAATSLPFNRQIGQAANTAKQGGSALLRMVTGRKPLTADQLIKLAPEEVAKLPALERQTYLRLKNLNVSQDLAAKSHALKTEYMRTAQLLKQEQATLGKSAPSVAAKRLEQLGGSFKDLSKEQSDLYDEGIDAAFDAAPAYDVPAAREELNKAVAAKYLEPGGPNEDPTEYRRMMDLLNQEEFVNRNEISLRSLHNLSKRLSGNIGKGARNKNRSWTPEEVTAQHLRDIVLDLMAKHGVDISAVNKDWANWVPVRDLGLKLQTPAGPGQLIRIVKGKDPVREKHFEQLEAMLGESLDKETRQVFDQLDSIKQKKVIEQSKLVEKQRLLSEQKGLEQKSAAAQKLQLGQMARHRDNIRKIVFAIAQGAGYAAGAGAVGYPIMRAIQSGSDVMGGN